MRSAELFVALALLGASGAGALPSYKPIDAPPTDPTKAVLLFAFDSQMDLGKVVLANRDGKPVAQLKVDAPSGEHTIRAFALPPGEYRLFSITVPMIRRKPYEVDDADDFELKADRVNYVGDLELRVGNEGLNFRFRDHAGRLIVRLREMASRFPGALPLAYIGPDGDDWIGSDAGTGR